MDEVQRYIDNGLKPQIKVLITGIKNIDCIYTVNDALKKKNTDFVISLLIPEEQFETALNYFGNQDTIIIHWDKKFINLWKNTFDLIIVNKVQKYDHLRLCECLKYKGKLFVVM